MRALEAAAVLLIGAAAFLAPLGRSAEPLPQITAADLDLGESLLHGVAEAGDNSVTTSMPLSTLSHALVFGHLRPEGARRAWLLGAALPVLAAAALACELASWPAAALTAALLSLGARDWLSLTNTLQSGYALLVVLAAWAQSRLARRREPRSGAAAGLALGASLLYRSPLLFVPPLLALGLAARAVRRERGVRLALILAAALPAAMLLPWAALNARLHGAFNPAEHMRSDTNVVSGALGLTVNIEGDIRSLDPQAGFVPGKVLGWAARRVLASPGDYARAILARLSFAFSLTPALCLAALAFLGFLRADRGARAVAGLAAYFLGVHASMPIAPPYLIPFQILLAVLAGAGASRALLPRLANAPAASRGAAGAFLGLLLASALVFCAFALVLVLRYGPLDAPAPELRARALARSPDDAWLLGRAGEAELRAGRAREAVPPLARALARRPLDGELASLHAYALALSGRPRALDALRLGPEASSQARHRLPFLRAAAAARAGKTDRARALVRAAVADWAATSATTNRLETSLERRVAAALRPPPVTGLFETALAPLTGAERRAFLLLVAAESGDERAADALAYGAALEFARGREADAAALWRRAVAANPGAVCAMPLERLGGPPRQKLPPAFFSACLERLPGDASLWSDRGIARALHGDDAGAVSDLRRALSLDPGSAAAAKSLAFVLERGRR